MYSKLADYCITHDVPTPAECVDYNMSRMFSIIRDSNFINNAEWNVAFRYFSNCLGVIIDARLFTEDEFEKFINDFKVKFANSYKFYSKKSKLFLDYINMRIIEFLYNYRYKYIRTFLNTQGVYRNLDDLAITHDWLMYIYIPFVSKYYLNFIDGAGLWEVPVYERKELSLSELLSLVEELDYRIDIDASVEKKPYDLLCIGGFVSLINDFKEATNDLDYLGDIPHNVKVLAYNIGVENNCIGWLSDLTSMTGSFNIPTIEELQKTHAFKPYKDYKFIKLWKLNDNCLLYLKLVPARLKDYNELKALLNKHNLTTPTSIINFIQPYLKFYKGDTNRLINKAMAAVNNTTYNLNIFNLKHIELLSTTQLLLTFTDTPPRIFDLNKALQKPSLSVALKTDLHKLKESNNFLKFRKHLNGIIWDNKVHISREDIFYLTEKHKI